MKTLNDYVGDDFSILLKDMGAFFAFSDDQFDKKRVQGVKYTNGGAGLIVPKDKFKEFTERNSALWEKAKKQRQEDFTAEEIIKYELSNYEAQITMDIDDTVDALGGYGYSREEIQRVYDEVFFPECVEKNLF